MLFMLVMEGLTRFILKDHPLGLLEGFKAMYGGVLVPVLQSADDTLIMCSEEFTIK